MVLVTLINIFIYRAEKESVDQRVTQVLRVTKACRETRDWWRHLVTQERRETREREDSLVNGEQREKR